MWYGGHISELQALTQGHSNDGYIFGTFSIHPGRVEISDRDIKEISSLVNLKCLDLSESGVTNEGLAYLETLRSIEELNLAYTNISAGLHHLAKLKRLRALDLSGLELGVGSIGLLSELPSLQKLVLIHESRIVNGNELCELKRSPCLEYLDLALCRLDESCYEVLKDFHKLTYLDISDTNLNEQQIVEITKALPNCKVIGL
jgi:Leucine-rich repeat (LRR) protein